MEALHPAWVPVAVVYVDPSELGGATRLDKTHAFAMFGEGIDPLIVVDARLLDQPWFSELHLFVILAHELAHIQLASEDEQAADERGIAILQEAGCVDAHTFYRQEYEARLEVGVY